MCQVKSVGNVLKIPPRLGVPPSTAEVRPLRQLISVSSQEFRFEKLNNSFDVKNTVNKGQTDDEAA